MGTKSSYKRLATNFTASAYNLYNSQKWSGSARNPSPILPNNVATAPDTIPGWKFHIMNDRSATTTLIGNYYAHKLGQFHIVKTDPPPFGRVSIRSGIVHIPDIPVVNELLTPIADGRAQIEFTNNFHKKTRAFQSGVAMAEFRETVGLFASPAKGLRNMTGRLMNKQGRIINRSNAKHYSKDLADSWLEYQFAVKPLVSDVNDAAKAMRALSAGRREKDRIMIRGEGREERIVSQLPNFTISGGDISGIPSAGPLICDLECVERCYVEYVGKWVSQAGDSHIPPAMLFGLNLANLAPTIWEATPWSFLIDYFSNVGDVLAACSMAYVDFAWINRRVKNTRTNLISAYRSSGNGQRLLTHPPRQYIRSVKVLREPKSPNFNPKFEFKIPGMKSTKWVNMAALYAGSQDMRRNMARRL